VPDATERADKWLFQARFFRSRSLAAALISGGGLRVNGMHAAKPAQDLRAGDTLTFAQGGRIRVIRVMALGERRGPAAEAQHLYRDLDSHPLE
jgi:ribosome-associated heat shock protein Hsp15